MCFDEGARWRQSIDFSTDRRRQELTFVSSLVKRFKLIDPEHDAWKCPGAMMTVKRMENKLGRIHKGQTDN